MCDSSPVSDLRPDSSPFMPVSVSDSDSKVHDSVSDSDSGPVTRWLGDESGTRPGYFGANARSFHTPKFPPNFTQYTAKIWHVSLGFNTQCLWHALLQSESKAQVFMITVLLGTALLTILYFMKEFQLHSIQIIHNYDLVNIHYTQMNRWFIKRIIHDDYSWSRTYSWYTVETMLYQGHARSCSLPLIYYNWTFPMNIKFSKHF